MEGVSRGLKANKDRQLVSFQGRRWSGGVPLCSPLCSMDGYVCVCVLELYLFCSLVSIAILLYSFLSLSLFFFFVMAVWIV